MLVIGDKEVESEGVSVRPRKGEDLGFKTLEEVVELIKADCEEPFNNGGMSYRFS
jgi:threonyl-tRNA synthetase